MGFLPSARNLAKAWLLLLGSGAALGALFWWISGYRAGPEVLVQEVNSLGDPVGSRMPPTPFSHPGHRKREEWPWILALTTRPGAELPPSWISLPSASSMTVGALDESETRALLAEVLLGAAVPDATRTAVLERSAGNPLYAIEFARMLAEGDAEPGADRAEASTPASVHAVIAARLDAVPADVRATVADAAVIGEEVWPEAIARSPRR